MKRAYRKLNVFFFGEDDAALADQLVYYGVFVSGMGLLGVIALI